MSVLVLQLIIKQWDKSQRTQQYVDERAKIASHYPINFPPARYTSDKQCVMVMIYLKTECLALNLAIT